MELRDVDLSIARDVVDGPPTRALVRDGRWLLGQALLPRSDEPAGATWAQVVAPQLYARRRLGAEAPPGSPYGPADVTAVVCTRDRPDLLAGCLDALTGLDPAPAAVLVVDSASTTSTTRDLAEARGATVVRADLPGLDRARNLGLAGCRTPLVAFVDDDARVDVHWARAAAEAFFDPRIALVTGLIIPAEVETTAQEWFERNGGMAKGFAPALYAAADVGFATHRLGAGACTAFRRDVLVGLGGFDPHLDVGTPTGGGGDLEMFWRVLAAGHTAFYWPQMAVRHVHRRELPGWRRQMRGNGSGYNAYLEAVAASGADTREEVRRHRRRWHVQRHVTGVLRAACALDRPELEELLLEAWASRRGPRAYRAGRAAAP